jgi:hypothetical protein
MGSARFASLKGKKVRLQFEIESATLYAFSGVKLAENQ